MNDGNDWTRAQGPFFGGAGYSDEPSGAPTARRHGALNTPLEQMSIARRTRPDDLLRGVFSQAWEKVKQHPVETILLSFLSTIFNLIGRLGGGGSDSSSDYDVSQLGDPAQHTSDVWALGGVTGLEGLGASGAEYLSILAQAHLAPVLPAPLLAQAGEARVGFIVFAVVFLLVVAVVGLVFWMVVSYANIVLWLRILRGHEVSLSAASRNVGSFLLMYTVTYMLMGLATLLGLIACIVPGMIISLGLGFVPFIVIDKNVTLVDALRASWQLTDGFKLQMFLFGILYVLLNIAGTFMFCVGVFVTNAVAFGAFAILYTRLATPGNAFLSDDEYTGSIPADVFS